MKSLPRAPISPIIEKQISYVNRVEGNVDENNHENCNLGSEYDLDDVGMDVKGEGGGGGGGKKGNMARQRIEGNKECYSKRFT